MSSPPPGPDYTWQPQPGNYQSAPTYGQPPRKSRAGLIIALIVVFALVALGAIGVLAVRLVNDRRTSDPEPGSAAVPPQTTTTRPTAARPTSARPTTPRPVSPRTTTATGAAAAAVLGQRFVTQLNANNPTAAAALACESSRQLIPTLMRTFLAPPTKLSAGRVIGREPTFVVPLTGSTKGSTITGVVVVHQIPPEPLCVRAFQVSPQ
ncbi:hypothetical protein [Kribbella sp. HUAS MG21]|uniref:Uncharacterized protein n=1 Tax=Kribbella sp. HUAS MG21 TaxID=3160966 RepID=A0AAU7TL54_9ACTN